MGEEVEDLYARTLLQMEECRDRAMEMAARINGDMSSLNMALMALHRDIAWLKREHATRLSRASGERRKEVLDRLAQSSQEILGDDC